MYLLIIILPYNSQEIDWYKFKKARILKLVINVIITHGLVDKNFLKCTTKLKNRLDFLNTLKFWISCVIEWWCRAMHTSLSAETAWTDEDPHLISEKLLGHGINNFASNNN